MCIVWMFCCGSFFILILYCYIYMYIFRMNDKMCNDDRTIHIIWCPRWYGPSCVATGLS